MTTRPEWTEEELQEAAHILRSFLVRLSESSAAAWAEMLSLERLEPLVIYEIDHHTGQRIIRESARPTLLEVRLAAIRVARDLGPGDWPAPRSLIEALRAVRLERVRAWRRDHPAPMLPPVASLSAEEIERNRLEAQRALRFLREKLGVAREAAAGEAAIDAERRARETRPLSDDRAAADARRAELRQQALRVAKEMEGDEA